MHDAFQRRRNIPIRFAQLGRFFLQNRAHRVGGRGAVERPLARQHFVENRAQAENVGARVERLAPDLLRRHVSRRSHHQARFCAAVGGSHQVFRTRIHLGEFGQPEVENLQPPIFRDEQVLRLQVAVQNSFFVRCRQPVGHLHGIVKRLALGNRPALEPVAQGFAFQ
jgi:hypothetical protein